MQNSAEKRPKRLVFIKGLIAGSILSLIILGSYCGSYAVVKQGQSMVRHIAIMTALKEHISSGGQIPQNLSELALLEYAGTGQRRSLSSVLDFEKERRDLKYYPDAWNRPGEILLQSSVLGSYVVAFGDGSLAALSYWDRQPRKELINEGGLGNEEHYLRSRCALGTLPVVTLFVLLVVSFFIIVIVERIIKRKRRRASAP